MAEMKWIKVRTGGLFSGVKVVLEYKFSKPVPNGEAQVITMMRDDTGQIIAKVEYEYSGQEGKITVFSVQDWENTKFSERLLKECISLLKKKKVKTCRAEIFQTDNKTHEKLVIFKKVGFAIETGHGSQAGYSSYNLIKKL